MKKDLLLTLQTTFAMHSFMEADADANPFTQFERWFEAAVAAELPEPNAMILATATADSHPSARVVLLRNADNQGFVFFTNYGSRKGQDILENPNVHLLFYWHLLGRQIRIDGRAQLVSREESQEYFTSRPRDSRIGAWASRQSTRIDSRQELEDSVREYEREFENKEVPVPPFWGGYRVVPSRFEFWQGRENRLHDRIVYEKQGNSWSMHRLSP